MGTNTSNVNSKRRASAFEALDNGILSCENPARMQQIADALSPEKNLGPAAQMAVITAPSLHCGRHGRRLPISDIDLPGGILADSGAGSPSRRSPVLRDGHPRKPRHRSPRPGAAIFERRIIKTTPGRFRTRVITNGVTPSLHAYYKNTGIKQYHKEHRALRTETTINNTRDFNIARTCSTFPPCAKSAFPPTDVFSMSQRLSHDCFVGHEALQKAQEPRVEANQRTSGLRFGDSKTHVLLQALLIFQLQVYGFSNRDLREQLAALLPMDMAELTPGRMTYLLRKVRLHDLITRVPKSHRYRLTEYGLRLSLFYTRAYNRLLEPAAARGFGDVGQACRERPR